MKYVTTIGESEYIIEILDRGRISVNGKVMEVDFESISGQPVYSMVIDGKSYEGYVYETEEEWQVLLLGQQYPVQVQGRKHSTRCLVPILRPRNRSTCVPSCSCSRWMA